MPTRQLTGRWVWVRRIVIGLLLLAPLSYLWLVGWEEANKVWPTIMVVIGLATLVAPYLLPPPSGGVTMPDKLEDELSVEKSGRATAKDGGKANTGIENIGSVRNARVSGSGAAVAEGSDSVANSGVIGRLKTNP